MGEKDKTIAEREQVTKACVSAIRVKAAKITLEKFIERLLLKPPNDQVVKRTHAGRPGREEVGQMFDTVSPSDERVFELSTLVLAEDLKVAILSFREGSLSGEKDSAEEESSHDQATTHELRAIREIGLQIRQAAGHPVFWTRVSMQDTLLTEVFKRLRAGAGRLSEKAVLGSLTPLPSRFDKRFQHVVLWDGSPSACDEVIRYFTRGEEAIRVQADRDSDFLDHLEAVLYQRRMTKSCSGFMPTLHRLWEKVRAWSIAGSAWPFFWETKWGEIEEVLKIHALTQDYFAAGGILPELKPVLWGAAYKDQTGFRTPPVSLKFDVAERIDRSHFRLKICPLPGLAYHRVVRWTGSPRDIEKQCRISARNYTAAQRFIYSTVPAEVGGSRNSVLLPHDFLETGTCKNLRDGIGVVLFPRHFLTPEPPVPVSSLVSIQSAKSQSKPSLDWHSLTESAEQHSDTFLILDLPWVMDGIRRRISEGGYSQQIDKIEEWQSLLLELSEDAGTSIGTEGMIPEFMRIRAEAALGADLWDRLEMSNDQSQGFESLAARLRELMPSLEHEFASDPVRKQATQSKESEIGTMRQVLRQFQRSLQATGAENPVPPQGLSETATDVITRTVGELLAQNPPPSVPSQHSEIVEQVFRTLLSEVDADFILRNLDPLTRVKIQLASETWRRRRQELICEEFWPKTDSEPENRRDPNGELIFGNFDADRVQTLISGNLRAIFKDKCDEVETICMDVLLAERADERFAIRSAIENLQRCILEGATPVAMHLETQESMLTRWEAQLRTTLNGRLRGLAIGSKKPKATRKMDAGRGGSKKMALTSYGQPQEGQAAETLAETRHGQEVEEIFSILQQLLTNGTGDNLLHGFIELVRDAKLSSWEAALVNVADYHSDTASIQRIREALKRYYSGASGLLSLEEVRAIFSRS